jgi:peptide deformylase
LTIRNILKMGHPLLLQQAALVNEFDTPELHLLIKDMIETMEAENGAGLAAPQIGESIQLVIFGFKDNVRYPDEEEVPFTVLINPTIKLLSDEKEDAWEGCLSVPGMRGLVSRPSHINYKGVDQFGQVIDRNAEGFHARVVQHECDHLFGILYPMRIKDMKQFGFHEAIFPE